MAQGKEWNPGPTGDHKCRTWQRINTPNSKTKKHSFKTKTSILTQNRTIKSLVDITFLLLIGQNVVIITQILVDASSLMLSWCSRALNKQVMVCWECVNVSTFCTLSLTYIQAHLHIHSHVQADINSYGLSITWSGLKVLVSTSPQCVWDHESSPVVPVFTLVIRVFLVPSQSYTVLYSASLIPGTGVEHSVLCNSITFSSDCCLTAFCS